VSQISFHQQFFDLHDLLAGVILCASCVSSVEPAPALVFLQGKAQDSSDGTLGVRCSALCMLFDLSAWRAF
jgi:hypothetical protein